MFYVYKQSALVTRRSEVRFLFPAPLNQWVTQYVTPFPWFGRPRPHTFCSVETDLKSHITFHSKKRVGLPRSNLFLPCSAFKLGLIDVRQPTKIQSTIDSKKSLAISANPPQHHGIDLYNIHG